MKEIEYTLVRSKRKTLVIQVRNGGEVTVRAPINASSERIKQFVDEKKVWIMRAVDRQKAKEKTDDFSFADGGKVKLFGEDYIVRLHDSRGVIYGDYAYLREEDPKQSFSNLATFYLRKYLGKRVPEIADRYGFEYSGFTVTKAMTRWGSCGKRNALHFTRALACLPTLAIDYVVVHELCHTRVRNHSAEFYAEVRRVMPEYKEAEKILKESSYIARILN